MVDRDSSLVPIAFQAGYGNTLSLLILTICYLKQTPDVHAVAGEIVSLFQQKNRRLSMQRLLYWHESIMLAKSIDILRNLIVYTTYTANTQMARHFTQHRTIDPFLSALSKQYKGSATCAVWLPERLCSTVIADATGATWYIVVVPKCNGALPKEFWVCLKQETKVQHIIIDVMNLDNQWKSALLSEINDVIANYKQIQTVIVMHAKYPLLMFRSTSKDAERVLFYRFRNAETTLVFDILRQMEHKLLLLILFEEDRIEWNETFKVNMFSIPSTCELIWHSQIMSYLYRL